MDTPTRNTARVRPEPTALSAVDLEASRGYLRAVGQCVDREVAEGVRCRVGKLPQTFDGELLISTSACSVARIATKCRHDR